MYSHIEHYPRSARHGAKKKPFTNRRSLILELAIPHSHSQAAQRPLWLWSPQNVQVLRGEQKLNDLPIVPIRS